MKILQLNNNYFRFPEGIKTVEEFIEFVNNSSQKFIKMTMLCEEHSVAPYFIEEEIHSVLMVTAGDTRIQARTKYVSLCET